ncbi:MAG: response regulator [Rhodospirillales bacterium]|nr:response regulator [Rhodospirillales bacterium]
MLIGDDARAAKHLEDSLLAGMGEGAAIVISVSANEAIDEMAQEGCDLLFVDIDATGLDWAETVAKLRSRAPGVPLIAIGRCGEETQAIEALQAGAQDCLSAAEVEGLPLLRAVRYAIERNRFQVQLEQAYEQIARDREIGGLNALSGPPPLPVTERSFGSMPLPQRVPDDFGILVRRYGELLDRALLGRSAKEYARLVADLNDIADRLGMLGAGPRDVIELHKGAMGSRLEDQSVRKNKAYVEEGRLLLVQLMGHLVSYYRSLSWGRGPAPRLRTSTPESVSVEPAARGKKPL